jgi:hypothetical protein
MELSANISIARVQAQGKNLPRPSSLQLGIEISGKTMGARGLMGIARPGIL